MNSLDNKNVRKESLWESQFKEKDLKTKEM